MAIAQPFFGLYCKNGIQRKDAKARETQSRETWKRDA